MTLQTNIEWPFLNGGELDSCEREITVEYTYSPGCRGARDSLGGVRGAGQALEPDEPPSVEITKVLLSSPTLHDRKATEDIVDEVSDWQRDNLEIKCLEDVAAGYEQEQEERAEQH